MPRCEPQDLIRDFLRTEGALGRIVLKAFNFADPIGCFEEQRTFLPDLYLSDAKRLVKELKDRPAILNELDGRHTAAVRMLAIESFVAPVGVSVRTDWDPFWVLSSHVCGAVSLLREG